MSFWRMPRADIGLGLLDLRSLPQCGSPGPAAQGYGLFVLSARDDTIGYYLGDSLGSLVKAPLKSALKTALALGEDITASTPKDILVELLTSHADPTGQARWKPLRGSLRQGVKLSLAGQEVWAAALDAAVRANTVLVFQADYRRNKADGVPLTALRKWTGSTMLKLWGRMGDDLATQLLPAEYVGDGWEAPSTTITESFNTADSPTLGPDLAWTELAGDADVVSNQCANITGTSEIRADSPLSMDDHYSQALIVTFASPNGGGMLVRFPNTGAFTWYMGDYYPGSATYRLYKRIDGAWTELAFLSEVSPGNGWTAKTEIDGSALAFFKDGVSKVTATDTAITGFLYMGARISSGTVIDNFEAGDLGVAAPKRWYYHQLLRQAAG